MRSSRISRDAAKLFECAPEPVSPPRRTTRSSLARFALATATTKDIKSEIRDIEDVANLPIRKRRRTATTSEPVSPNEMKTKHVKTEQIKAEPVKLKRIKSEDIEDVLSSIPSPPPKAPRRARKPARKAVDPSTGDTTIEPPSDWEVMYNTVRRMRAPGGAAYGAAVDTMGCERLADSQSSPKDQRYHTLVSLQLSSQTKDVVTSVVIKRLQTELPAYKSGAPVGLNVNNMLSVEPGLLNQMIWTVGFHNNKTKYLKQTAEILRDEWNGDIPDTIEGLMSLPGVGPKMAYLCMSVAWNRTEGIGVDVHVHRITNLWGWNKTKNPEETRLALQSWLPHDRWREINSLLVGLGQAVCLPVGRKCGECELGFEGLCKAADRKKVAEGRKMKAEKVEAESDDTAVKVEAKLEVVEPVDVKAEEDVKLEEDAQGVVVKHEA